MVSTDNVIAMLGPGTRLSEGSLIQATILAHLLGIPLLRLDAQIAVIPAVIPAAIPAVIGAPTYYPVPAPDTALGAHLGGRTVPTSEVSGTLADAVAILGRASHTLASAEPV